MLTLLLSTLIAPADEGMWLPEQLPEVAAPWVDRGLSIDPEVLADPLGHPLGAIVTLGFCSASFVSPDGLVATNHHCAEGYLQQISTAEANRHLDGFSSATRADEASVGPSGRLRVVESLTDVTDEVMRGVGKRTPGAKRVDRMEANRKALVAACEEEPDRRCAVSGFDGGARWRLVKTFEIEDVRLVFAPPMSVGQFGGEIDNWMWPRHSADFAFVRAYVAPDGSAAPYSEDNVPYAPKHHLEVGPGVSEDDVVMVAGFPGRTERHLLAMDLAWEAESSLPDALKRVQAAIDVMEAHVASTPEAAPLLGRRLSGYANWEKNTRGMLDALEDGSLLEAKRGQEAEILAWIDADRKRVRAHGKAHDALAEALADAHVRRETDTALGSIRAASSLLGVTLDAVRWATQQQEVDDDRDPGFQDRDRTRREGWYRSMSKGLYLPAERDLMALALAWYAEADEAAHVPVLDAWIAEQGGDEAVLAALFDTSPALADDDARIALLDATPDDLAASDDPWLQLAVALEGHLAAEREASKGRRGDLQRLFAGWMAAKQAWADDTDVLLYPDANSTLRVTLGTVTGYRPADGLVATPFTTLPGVAAKAGGAPFDAPQDLLDRIEAGPDSRFAHPDLGTVPVDFLSTLDITGGNSGSAILDGQGRWVGLAFDGNWESIAADWHFDADVARCIGVDIRYVLWLLDGHPDGSRLLDELGVSAD